MPEKSFPLTPEKFSAYLVQLPAQGFTVNAVDPDNGQVEGKGVRITYQFDGTTLKLIGVEKPWIVSWNYIFDLIASHLE